MRGGRVRYFQNPHEAEVRSIFGFDVLRLLNAAFAVLPDVLFFDWSVDQEGLILDALLFIHLVLHFFVFLQSILVLLLHGCQVIRFQKLLDFCNLGLSVLIFSQDQVQLFNH